MTNRFKKKWDGLDKGVQKWATRVGAVATIVGTLAAGSGWIINQLDNAVAARIESQTEALQQEVQKLSDRIESQDLQTELSLTRLELLTLINTRPRNVVEIEKVARHYFQDLSGDWWMSEIYSEWASKYGGDMTYVIE